MFDAPDEETKTLRELVAVLERNAAQDQEVKDVQRGIIAAHESPSRGSSRSWRR
jgi:hypothetical protein